MKAGISDIELLSAYMDGQLSDDKKVLLESRLAKEPELKALLIKLEVTERELNKTISEIDAMPMSDSLQRVLSRKNQDNPLMEIFAAIMVRIRHLVADQTIPATAVVMVIVGAIYVSEFTVEEQRVPSETPLISAEALQNLHNIVAGETVATGDGLLVELLAFRRADEVLCKQYYLESENPREGIACFEMGEWANVAIVEQSRARGITGYKPASGDSSPEIDDFIEKNMVNGVLTVEDEKTAMFNIRKER